MLFPLWQVKNWIICFHVTTRILCKALNTLLLLLSCFNVPHRLAYFFIVWLNLLFYPILVDISWVLTGSHLERPWSILLLVLCRAKQRKYVKSHYKAKLSALNLLSLPLRKKYPFYLKTPISHLSTNIASLTCQLSF